MRFTKLFRKDNDSDVSYVPNEVVYQVLKFKEKLAELENERKLRSQEKQIMDLQSKLIERLERVDMELKMIELLKNIISSFKERRVSIFTHDITSGIEFKNEIIVWLDSIKSDYNLSYTCYGNMVTWLL